jgi:hypothetical protein
VILFDSTRDHATIPKPASTLRSRQSQVTQPKRRRSARLIAMLERGVVPLLQQATLASSSSARPSGVTLLDRYMFFDVPEAPANSSFPS